MVAAMIAAMVAAMDCCQQTVTVLANRRVSKINLLEQALLTIQFE